MSQLKTNSITRKSLPDLMKYFNIFIFFSFFSGFLVFGFCICICSSFFFFICSFSHCVYCLLPVVATPLWIIRGCLFIFIYLILFFSGFFFVLLLVYLFVSTATGIFTDLFHFNLIASDAQHNNDDGDVECRCFASVI